MTLAELKAKLAKIVTETRAIAEKAQKENRAFSADEETAVNTATQEIENLKGEIAKIEKRDNLLSSLTLQTADLNKVEERRTAASPSDTLENIGLSKKEQRNYSLLRAIQCKLDGRPLDGLEGEVSKEIEKRSGKAPQGFYIPSNLSIRGEREVRADLTTTTGSGAVNTLVMYSDFIDILRNASVCGQAGARFLTGLNAGTVTIPALTTGNTVYWVAENNAPTESSPVIGQVTLTAKTVGAYTDISRRMMLQAGNMDVEALIRGDIAAAIAVGIDAAALAGSGASNSPTGLLYDTNVTEVEAVSGTAGGACDWTDIVNLETAVADANALLATAKLAYVTNTKVRGLLKRILKASASGSTFIWESGDVVNGAKALATNSIPSNLSYTGSNPGAAGSYSALLFGNFDDLVIGSWGTGIDILVDPYTGSAAGTVRVRGLQDAGVALRRGASFARMFDISTT